MILLYTNLFNLVYDKKFETTHDVGAMLETISKAQDSFKMIMNNKHI